jgi:hypothetical protein
MAPTCARGFAIGVDVTCSPFPCPWSESRDKAWGLPRREAAGGGWWDKAAPPLGRQACRTAQELEIQGVFTHSTVEFGTAIKLFLNIPIMLAAVAETTRRHPWRLMISTDQTNCP